MIANVNKSLAIFNSLMFEILKATFAPKNKSPSALRFHRHLSENRDWAPIQCGIFNVSDIALVALAIDRTNQMLYRMARI
jgi:hypothetical protein